MIVSILIFTAASLIFAGILNLIIRMIRAMLYEEEYGVLAIMLGIILMIVAFIVYELTK